jgi:hypothetical protein
VLVELVIIAFFFLLRVGEHAPPTSNGRTRATQIRRKDLQFWKDGLLARLLPLSTLADLLAADGVTIVMHCLLTPSALSKRVLSDSSEFERPSPPIKMQSQAHTHLANM